MDCQRAEELLSDHLAAYKRNEVRLNQSYLYSPVWVAAVIVASATIGLALVLVMLFRPRGIMGLREFPWLIPRPERAGGARMGSGEAKR